MPTAPPAVRVLALCAGLALTSCVQGAASTTACPAFAQWEADGFPRDLSSSDAGPRYLRFLAEVTDTAPSVASDASLVLDAAQRTHEAWVGAGGPDGPPQEVERAAEFARQQDTPAVMAALQHVLAYGEETCDVSVP